MINRKVLFKYDRAKVHQLCDLTPNYLIGWLHFRQSWWLREDDVVLEPACQANEVSNL